MCQARIPSHSSSSGACAKVQPQGTRHLQTSNQSPASCHWGTSAMATSLRVAPLELVHLGVAVFVRERKWIVAVDLPLHAVSDLGLLVLEPVGEVDANPVLSGVGDVRVHDGLDAAFAQIAQLEA